MERCRRRYGPIFRVAVPGVPPVAFVTDAESARALYAAEGGRAGDARRPYLAPLVGERSLLCLEGDEWRRQRRLLAPPLHGERVTEWREGIAAIAAERIDRWPQGETIEARPLMQAITLEVILRIVFGIEEGRKADELRGLLPRLLAAIENPVVFGLPSLRRRLERSQLARRMPGSPLRRFLELRARTDELLYAEIAERRADLEAAAERTDVLSALVCATDENGERMEDAEIRDELMTMLTAGHETTATALAWSVERLVHNPEILDRLVGELDRGETEYLDAVIREVLRTRPVVFDTPRELTTSLRLGDYDIPSGWWASAAISLVHGDPKLFPDPDAFDPERFLADGNGDAASSPIRGWIPFGGGNRRCAGSQLALLELQTVIPALLSRRRIEAGDSGPERQRAQHVTLVPARRARIVTSPR